MLMLYLDNRIFSAPTHLKINEAYKLLMEPVGEHPVFYMTNEIDLWDYLEVRINWLFNGLLKLMQLHLV